ncbi:unnamed protein product [Gongylonema pulchrum]|uniref:tRNA-intron lyase n=1 Tax=Gongylonema pulchrum TaxID=637853 RepID=A0A183EYV9_9BILA|nr:unnamed protein product [Gongylonema pulchrum]
MLLLVFFRAADNWKRFGPADESLRLGMEEALYLSSELGVLQIFSSDGHQKFDPNTVWKKFYHRYGSQFMRRYVVYRFFRQQGWVVRSGLQYGADFILYCDGPEYHHSSAAVRVVPSSDVLGFAALNRELNNMKKTLIEVSVNVPQDCDIRCLDCVRWITVSLASSFLWKTSANR